MNGVWIPAILLGVVQGLTEFLPVSSTAHLAALPVFLGWSHPLLGSLPFDVALHLGTLVALLAAFGGTWVRLLRDGMRGRGEHARLARGIALGTVPALVAGVLFHHAVEDRLRGLRVMAVFVAGGAALLWWAHVRGTGRRTARSVTLPQALLIGCAQACAILPGLSRSGVTISAGLLLGLGRAEAARYSFLLSAPVIAAAIVWEGRKLGGLGPGEIGPLIAGIAAAGLVGAVAIRWLLRAITALGFLPFVVYRLLLAAVLAVA